MRVPAIVLPALAPKVTELAPRASEPPVATPREPSVYDGPVRFETSSTAPEPDTNQPGDVVGSDPAPLNTTAPPATVVAPVYVLGAVRASVPEPSFTSPSELAPPLPSTSGAEYVSEPPALEVSRPIAAPGRKPSVPLESPRNVATSESVNSPAPPTLTASAPPLPIVRLAAVHFDGSPP